MIVATGVCRVEAATYTKGAFAGMYSPRWTSLRSSSYDGFGDSNASALKQNNKAANEYVGSDGKNTSSSFRSSNANNASYSSAGSGDLLGTIEHNASGGSTHQGHGITRIFYSSAICRPGEPCFEERVLFEDDGDDDDDLDERCTVERSERT